MLPGFSGHLISEHFLERSLEGAERDRDAPRLRRALIEWRSRCQQLGPASGLRTIFEVGAAPFMKALGYADPSEVLTLKEIVAGTLLPDRADQSGRPSAAASPPQALAVAGWGARLDSLWRPAVLEARRRGAAWCLLFNGTQVRLFSALRLYSRRFVEFDLDVAIDDERSCATLAAILGCSAIAGSRQLDELIERSEANTSLVCRSLRDGVLAASSAVLDALARRSARASADAALDQALTIVYRILFLLFAEARQLVPVWHPVYRDSYGLDALRELYERQPGCPGLWDALRAVCRLAHGGCRAGDLHVTPFNGRLFAPGRTPLAERRDLDDDAARTALTALATRPAADGSGRERISYRDLGVEQLGAVYETLLDYTPHADTATGRVTLRAGGGRRKATGTFYTPQPIAQYLVRRTLAPLVDDAPPERILALKILDPAMGSGAFLVAACAFLADAYEASLIRSGACGEIDLGPAERAGIRRTIAERCLFGVDVNPMAVQLARLSLWLATLAADRPLTFLDHHLQSGDSVIGAWLSNLRAAPSANRHPRQVETPSLFDDETFRAALSAAMPVRFSLALDPNDTPDQIKKKDRALETISGADSMLARWKKVADLWCAPWFADRAAVPASAFGPLSDFILAGRSVLPDATARKYGAEGAAIARDRRFFHWELEFPEAFFQKDGHRLPDSGFDAVIGNPPWDMIRADMGAADMRSRDRRATGSTLRFTRDSGTYTAQRFGHANSYQLFVERAVALTRRGGRIGLLLPSGMVTDHGSATLRRLLFERCAVDAIVGFDNTDAVFPIHRSMRFLLMTATSGMATTAVRCRLGERNPSVLDADIEDESWFPVRVTPAFLRRVSGQDLALPDFRSPLDVAIVERLTALFPQLGDVSGWHVSFGRELNATDNRAALQANGRGLPVFEGKHLAPFRTAGQPRWSISSRDAARLLGGRERRSRLAYRDVAGASNRVTLIAALLPSQSASTHTLFCLRTPLTLARQHFLCGLFNSFVLNYLVRLRVTTHVTTGIVEWLPAPLLDERHPQFRRVAELARLLAAGESPAALRELNTSVARLYELNAEQFRHILDSFPLFDREERERTFLEFRRGG